MILGDVTRYHKFGQIVGNLLWYISIEFSKYLNYGVGSYNNTKYSAYPLRRSTVPLGICAYKKKKEIPSFNGRILIAATVVYFYLFAYQSNAKSDKQDRQHPHMSHRF